MGGCFGCLDKITDEDPVPSKQSKGGGNLSKKNYNVNYGNNSKGRISYDKKERSVQVNKQSIEKANEYFYFMRESYNNCITKLQELSDALRKGDRKNIQFQTQTLNFLIDNSSIQFQECVREFPPDFKQELDACIKEFRRDFVEFMGKGPKNEELNEPRERILKILDREEIPLTQFKEVSAIDPKLLLKSFEQIQISYNKTDAMKASIKNKRDISIPKLNSNWRNVEENEIL